VDKCDWGKAKVGDEFASAENTGSKVSFYFTNFPDLMPMFQLRLFFEVCGILSDVYIARKRNFRGQTYGFLCFLNVRNIDKLAFALNNVWIGNFQIWAHKRISIGLKMIMWRLLVLGGRRRMKGGLW
jgi:hypothetical protein